MSTTPEHFGWFTNDQPGLTNLGTLEAQRGWQPTPQQHWESSREYEIRTNAYHYETQRQNGQS